MASPSLMRDAGSARADAPANRARLIETTAQRRYLAFSRNM
jgi:hypothetical protein